MRLKESEEESKGNLLLYIFLNTESGKMQSIVEKSGALHGLLGTELNISLTIDSSVSSVSKKIVNTNEV